jgi:hypothetical protein
MALPIFPRTSPIVASLFPLPVIPLASDCSTNRIKEIPSRRVVIDPCPQVGLSEIYPSSILTQSITVSI